MPFKQVGPDKYVDDNGREYTQRQVDAYYATDGFKREPDPSRAKRHQGMKTTTRSRRGR